MQHKCNDRKWLTGSTGVEVEHRVLGMIQVGLCKHGVSSCREGVRLLASENVHLEQGVAAVSMLSAESHPCKVTCTRIAQRSDMIMAAQRS